MAIQRVAGLFDNQSQAESAVQGLVEAGIARERISLTMRDRDDLRKMRESTGTKAAEGAGTGATAGTIAGGFAGLLIGAGLLAIPGIGPILALGPLSAVIGTGAAAAGAAAVGAGAGAATGGLIGALVGSGVPEEEAHVYSEGVRRGGVLVAVDPASETERNNALEILRNRGAVDLTNRGREYREGGWHGYNPDAPEYPLHTPEPDRISAERR